MSKLVPITLAVVSAAYLISAVTLNIFTAPGTQAQETDTLGWIDSFEGDGFYNFDFKSSSAVSTNVDWPLRFIFNDNAEIDKVKDKIDGCGGDPTISPEACSSGSIQGFYYDDGAQFPYTGWDGDGGKKQANYCLYGANHIRLYANDTVDRNYNSIWGYYIFGTVHLDYEGGGTYNCTEYYSTETQETWWRNRFSSSLGWDTASSKSFYNYDAGHWDEYGGHDHYTASSGYGSFVEVP